MSTSPATVNPSYLELSPDGNYLYAVNETGSEEPGIDGFVSAFRLLEEGKQLGFINQVSSGGDYPCYIQIDSTGRFAVVANYGSGNVALFPLNMDGSLKAAVSTDQHEGRGPASQQESAHAHSIVISNDNQFVYSCDLGTDQILIYKMQTDSARLIKAGQYSTRPGSGPRHLEFHPNKNILYVINELNATIECMHRDTITGALTRFQVISTIAEGNAAEAGSADIHITPSGDFLYATNRGNFNTLAMYVADAGSGELLLTGFQSVKGKTPRNFVIDPTGKWLLVANQDSNTLVTFRIDPKTGVLVDSGIEIKVPSPVCLKFGSAKIM
jgi:6-phosphogluconolactonase